MLIHIHILIASGHTCYLHHELVSYDCSGIIPKNPNPNRAGRDLEAETVELEGLSEAETRSAMLKPFGKPTYLLKISISSEDLVGKSSKFGPFSTAMLAYWRAIVPRCSMSTERPKSQDMVLSLEDPRNGWFTMENPMKTDDGNGYHPIMETSIYSRMKAF